MISFSTCYPYSYFITHRIFCYISSKFGRAQNIKINQNDHGMHS